MYDLDKVKEMFKKADKLIQKQPELLSMDVDRIFDELDGENQEMIHIRWGVMTRAKLKELKSYDVEGVLNFMRGIQGGTLLCEYVGYILQKEYNIRLLDILLKAYDENCLKDVYPIAEACIEYESDCMITRYDTILGIMESLEDTQKLSFVDGYSSLLVKCGKEEIVLENYFKKYSTSSELLVEYIARRIYPQKEEEARLWFDKYISADKTHCIIGASYILRESLYTSTIFFEKYYSKIEEIINTNKMLWTYFIESYVMYIEHGKEINILKKVQDRLKLVKNSKLDDKRKCLQMMQYRAHRNSILSEVMEEILSESFDGDICILGLIDIYLSDMFDKKPEKTLELLYEIYRINGFSGKDCFLKELSQLSLKMVRNQEKILEIWWNRFLYGVEEEFRLSIEIYKKVLSVDEIDEYIKEKEVSNEEVLRVIEGLALFAIEEDKKIAKLTFTIASYLKNNEVFYEYCKDYILINYSGVLYEEAKQRISSSNNYEQSFANRIINYYDDMNLKLIKGYEDRDYAQPTERSIIYQRFLAEQNKRIEEEAHKKSFFARYFPVRKMKYGKRYAYVQIIKGGCYSYSVAEYEANTYSIELPRDYINNPVKYLYMKNDYLEKRKNATNN